MKHIATSSSKLTFILKYELVQELTNMHSLSELQFEFKC
jgi:hypothetical protein